MLVCPNCNNENRVGSVFCKSCGEKLDVSDLRAPTRSERRGGARNWSKYIRLLILLVIIGSAVYVIIGMFTPLDMEPKKLSEIKKSQIWETYERLIEGKFTKARTLTFTPAEASYLFNKILVLGTENKDDSGIMIPENIMFEFLPDDRVKAVLRYQVFNRFVSDTVITGTLRIDEESGKVMFEPETHQIGKIPMKWFLSKIVLKRFNVQFKDRPKLEEARRRIHKLNIQKGKARILVK